jgi:Na+/H+-dicarboxylate symporter/ABC-type amino acid transport substrate-binding protein
MAGFLKIAGDAFIMLLQITVIPYIMVSLITALGRLSIEDTKSLGLKAGGILLVLWGVGLAVVLVTPLAFPEWPSASFFSTSQVEETEPVDFLQLYIPANPFFSLANATVPAIVVFSVLIGLALTNVENKNALLKPLAAVADALMGVAGFIAKLAPYGIFALTASAAGTIDLEELNRLQVYVVTYVVLALILSFWLLPGLVATTTSLRHGTIIRTFRGPLIAAFATGNVLILLPILAADCKKLLQESEQHQGELDGPEARSSIDVLIPAAFNFPSLGLVLSLMFVLFAGWYIGAAVPVSQYAAFSLAGLASLFGSTVIAIPFLLDLLELPQDLFQVFLTVDVLGSRFGTLLAAMHIVTIALIGSFALQGKARVRWLSLARLAGISIVLFAAALIGIRAFYTYVVVAPYTKHEALKGIHLLVNPQQATTHTEMLAMRAQSSDGPADLVQIKSRGTLRVCYSPEDYPSAFFNEENPPQLVGFDIEMAHRFAQRMDLLLEFLPVDTEKEAAERLNAGSCDIFMSTIPISAGRAEMFAMTRPIYTSSIGVIVRDHRRDEFQTYNDLRNQGVSLRLAVPGASGAIARARIVLPEAVLLPIYGSEQQKQILDEGAEDVDAIAARSEEGAAWTLLYPDFSLVVPKPVLFRPVGYAVARGNDELLEVFNAWLVALKSRGRVDELYRYWMLGEAATTERPPRWSVIRDVLHWVD